LLLLIARLRAGGRRVLRPLSRLGGRLIHDRDDGSRDGVRPEGGDICRGLYSRTRASGGRTRSGPTSLQERAVSVGPGG
jgi:hypothetical protein